MNLNGKDYVFMKATGDAEWWKERIREKQSRENYLYLCMVIRLVLTLWPVDQPGVI